MIFERRRLISRDADEKKRHLAESRWILRVGAAQSLTTLGLQMLPVGLYVVLGSEARSVFDDV